MAPKGPVPYTTWAGRRGNDDSDIAPFLASRLAAFIHFLSNIIRSKRFLSFLILTLSWYLKNKIRSRWEKLASSYNPFFRVVQTPFELQLGSRETPHAAYPETEEERYRWRNQCRAAQATWVRCEPSTTGRRPRTGELARSCRRCAQQLHQNYCHCEDNRVGLPGPLWSPSREGVTHSVQVTRWARTRCSRSSIQAPNFSESGSPPPSSRAAL